MEPGKRGARAYFDVDDINSGAARDQELGGEAGEAMPVPSMGWFAIFTDPLGNEFGIWQNDRSAPTRPASHERPAAAPQGRRGGAAELVAIDPVTPCETTAAREACRSCPPPRHPCPAGTA